MASRKYNSAAAYFIPFVIFCILILVAYILRADGPSPLVKCTQWLSDTLEGFATTKTYSLTRMTTPRCPSGYVFFNDEAGESFCCQGTVDPANHKCVSRSGGSVNVCAFKPNSKNPVTGANYPMCSALLGLMWSEKEQKECPKQFPHYASAGKCCKTGTDMDGEHCISSDNVDKTRYCKLNPPLQDGEQLCSSLRLQESAACPSGTNRVLYPLGKRETAKYGQTQFEGLPIPVCFGMDKACIPDNIVSILQDKYDLYTDKNDIGNWKYSCSGMEKAGKLDFTMTMDTSYL